MQAEASTTPPLECQFESLNGVEIVVCRGEIDIATAAQFGAALEKAETRPGVPVIADLTEITFMDSTGLRVLLEARARLEGDARSLAVVCAPGPLRRLFELTSTLEVLRVQGTRDDALAAVAT